MDGPPKEPDYATSVAADDISPIPGEDYSLVPRDGEIAGRQWVLEKLHQHSEDAPSRRLRGHEEVRAYWQAQFEVAHPLVSLEGLALGTDSRTVVTVRTGLRDAEGDHWAEEPVEHVYTFEKGLITHMEVRPGPGRR